MRKLRRRRAHRRRYITGIAAGVGSVLLLMVPVFVLRRRNGAAVTTRPQVAPEGSVS